MSNIIYVMISEEAGDIFDVMCFDNAATLLAECGDCFVNVTTSTLMSLIRLSPDECITFHGQKGRVMHHIYAKSLNNYLNHIPG